MPLQIGAWTLDANGTLGQLTIDSVDTAGVLNGSLDLNGEHRQIEGFWDEISQEISFNAFQRWVILGIDLPPNVGIHNATYTGHLFTDSTRMAGISGAVVYTLAGSYEASQSTGASARRHLFAWYAQIGVD